MKAIEIRSSIYKTIDKIFGERIKSLSFDKTVIGSVKQYRGNNSYIVFINGSERTLKAIDGLVLKQNDVVCVLYPQNNPSQAFIYCKLPG